jgi:hypothetical protein
MKSPCCLIAAVLLSLIPVLSHSGDWFSPPTTGDIALMAVNTALIGVDWGQSRYIAEHPDDYREVNPILGAHPSTGKVNTYFSAALPLYWLTAWALPPKEDHGYKSIINREYFSIAVAIMEGATVGNNLAIGIGVKF